MAELANKDSMDWIAQELAELQQSNLLRKLSIRESPHVGGKVQIAGRQLVDFGSNDYLSLSADSDLVNSIKNQAGYVGWGSGASPLVHGRGTLHARLEEELAGFTQRQAALSFSTGFMTNLGVITAVASDSDIIFSDEKNHASIIDGCRLSRAKVEIYRHTDVDHLKQLMDQSKGKYRRGLIVTDGLFSMEGNLAPLVQIVELAKDHGAMLMVDEAHAIGVFGDQGQGVAEHLGVHDEIDIIVGTLSKAMGCQGGFVAGTQDLIDWITNRARSYIFSTAVPDATCMAAVQAIEKVNSMKPDREQLLLSANRLRTILRENGFDVGASESQIIPILLGDSAKAVAAKEFLMESGYFVPAMRPPAVAPGSVLLRISLNIQHTQEMIDGLVRALLSYRNQTVA